MEAERVSPIARPAPEEAAAAWVTSSCTDRRHVPDGKLRVAVQPKWPARSMQTLMKPSATSSARADELHHLPALLGHGRYGMYSDGSSS